MNKAELLLGIFISPEGSQYQPSLPPKMKKDDIPCFCLYEPGKIYYSTPPTNVWNTNKIPKTRRNSLIL